MVKGKGNIFGKKDNKQNNTDEVKTETANTETMAAENENLSGVDTETDNNAQAETGEETPGAGQEQNKEAEYQAQAKEFQDKYIRLMAEFDNFRKRSLKERTELIKSAGEDILVNILPVMDDFERGLAAMENSQDIEAVKQGVSLIYNKFKDFLTQRGIKEIDSLKQEFNVDIHEALTKIPVPEDELKGKVVDVIQKGYTLNEKVIRFAKVVIGE